DRAVVLRRGVARRNAGELMASRAAERANELQVARLVRERRAHSLLAIRERSAAARDLGLDLVGGLDGEPRQAAQPGGVERDQVLSLRQRVEALVVGVESVACLVCVEILALIERLQSVCF